MKFIGKLDNINNAKLKNEMSKNYNIYQIFDC